MSDAEWLRGIADSGWNNDEWSPETKAMLRRVADRLDVAPMGGKAAVVHVVPWSGADEFHVFARFEDACDRFAQFHGVAGASIHRGTVIYHPAAPAGQEGGRG